MRYLPFYTIVIGGALFLYSSNILALFASSKMFWAVVAVIIVLFIVAVKIIGLPSAKK